jgi:hypothetical protein
LFLESQLPDIKEDGSDKDDAPDGSNGICVIFPFFFFFDVAAHFSLQQFKPPPRVQALKDRVTVRM